eukprot:CAMPEP_0115103204 /NCGR_PEP_ID=MMETSP0227-20121206/34430_1 /TAXON_ID=89957 /ORGANISM="Polarella glacialis, Strain CCMP 1383" /LENGTH=59 /DNA_ID=CAMNT_0002499585 /DNA_START=54 /DNA_END=233 /DNA_ORIENTATION=-
MPEGGRELQARAPTPARSSEEITRHSTVICEQRAPGTHMEMQKKMDFFQQVLGAPEKKK